MLASFTGAGPRIASRPSSYPAFATTSSEPDGNRHRLRRFFASPAYGFILFVRLLFRCGAARGMSPGGGGMRAGLMDSTGFSWSPYPRRERLLAVLAFLAAFTSIAALLFHAAGWIRMPYTVSFLTLPGMVLLVVILARGRRSNHALLVNRLLVGATAGATGLVFYDVARWLVQALLPIEFDAFFSMPAFGALMTGMPHDSTAAIVGGWLYHISNGLTFGIIYALIAGPSRWWWGLVWGAGLEAGMLFVYPALFRGLPFGGLLVVSLVGHAVFGAAVGLTCERRAIRGFV